MKEWIALNMTPGVGPRAAARLLERFGSAEGVFGALRSELERLRLRPEAVESIALRDRFAEAARELERVREIEGADVLVLDDGAYPALLREIPDPPVTLYVRGRWAECLDAPCVGVVGSRRCSAYGQNVALSLARELGSRGASTRPRTAARSKLRGEPLRCSALGSTKSTRATTGSSPRRYSNAAAR